MSLLARRTRRLDPAVKGMLWACAAGLQFSLLNALMRSLAISLDPFETQFLRYLCGLLVMLPLLWRSGLAAYMPSQIGGQFARGAVHTLGLCLWFTALPNIALADMTAIGFTGPIFIMLGAAMFFGEPMRWDRWAAALVGFGGVLVVVGPRLAGTGGPYALIMLASSPVFAASFLITKALTRYESAGVIVFWQAISVTVFSLPMALLHWQHPTLMQWGVFLLCGVLGSSGHYCLTRSFGITDMSATQSVKFLDLVWSSLLGFLMFSDHPSSTTILGATVILASTVWLARREANR